MTQFKGSLTIRFYPPFQGLPRTFGVAFLCLSVTAAACTPSIRSPNAVTVAVAGALDASFGSGTGKAVLQNLNGAGASSNEGAYAVALDSSRRIVIGGTTANAALATNGVDAFAIRVKTDGTLDTSFAVSGIFVKDNPLGTAVTPYNDVIHGLTIDSSDMIWLVGQSKPPTSGNPQAMVYRLNSAGDLDLSFNSQGFRNYNGTVGGSYANFGYDISVDALGAASVVGSAHKSVGANRNAIIWKLNSASAAGALDTAAFDAGGAVGGLAGAVWVDGGSQTTIDDDFVSMTHDTSGNIVATGFEGPANPQMTLYKFTAAGGLVAGFNGANSFVFYTASTQSRGRKVIAGPSDSVYVIGGRTIGTDMSMTVWKYTSAGVLDSTFGTSGILTVPTASGGLPDEGLSACLDQSGRIVIGGYVATAGTATTATAADAAVWRVTPAGVLDTTFGSGAGYVTFNNGGTYAGAVPFTRTIGTPVGDPAGDVIFGVACDNTASRIIAAGRTKQTTGYAVGLWAISNP